jgi:1-acyl-sn-glycerol-3-phosphate acyltransferase
MAGRCLPIDGATARPYAGARAGARWLRPLCGGFLRLSGWKMEGDWPGLDKAVLVAAPHTSNWDGLYMLAAAGFYRIKLRWMGKKSLTTGPFGWLMLWLGCVPVDRSASQDLVRTMSEQFAARAAMVLAIAPEGSRTRATEWKSGFYRIAHGAGVPIVVSVLDYGTRTIRLAAVLHPDGDYDADLAAIQACYDGAKGKHQEKFAG